MTINKNQKIATVTYLLFIILIFLFLTPYIVHPINNYAHADEQIFFGNFFFIHNPISYIKFFTEIGLISLVYLLSLVILK